MDKLEDKLLEKAKEAFSLAIEVYNKPTIKYRVEGFSHFICNAWELILKAHMIKTMGENSIYYKDNPGRTLSLENCIQKVFTNKKAPLRLNLEKIIELRNTSTHFITEEYEMVYIPLFQSCVFNFIEKMMDFHSIDMTEIIPQNFLTLSVSMKSFNKSEIRAKYPNEISERLISSESEISKLSKNSNDAFSVTIEHLYYITKDKSKATNIIGIDSSADSKAQIIRELKDPNKTHKYTMKKVNKEINARLKRSGINFEFNQYHFQLFCNYYGLKENERFCYINTIGSSPTYSYSIQTIDFIVDEIKKDPENIIDNIKNRLKKK